MALKALHGNRTIRSVFVDGVELRPNECVFVFRNPKGEVAGFKQSNHELLDNIASAARSYWAGQTPAILRLNEGWRVEFMTLEQFQKIAFAK